MGKNTLIDAGKMGRKLRGWMGNVRGRLGGNAQKKNGHVAGKQEMDFTFFSW